MSATGMVPTRVHAKPLSGGGSPWQCVMLCALPTSTTVLLLGKHQRVSVAGFSSTIVVPDCVTVNVMFGLSQHHHHHGNSARTAGLASLRLISSVRATSGANALVRWADAKAWPRMRYSAAGRGKASAPGTPSIG